MKQVITPRKLILLLLVFACLTATGSQSLYAQRRGGATRGRRSVVNARAPQQPVLERNVRAHMEFLASDAMQGRGSGTQFELLAGQYIAAQLRQFGVEPAGDVDAAGQKTFLQTVDRTRPALAAAPTLSFSVGAQSAKWTHGQEVLVTRMSAPRVSGTLQKSSGGEPPRPGAFVLLSLPATVDARELMTQARALGRQGAAAVLVGETPAWRERWATQAAQLPQLPAGADAAGGALSLVVLSADAFKQLQEAADGTQVTLEGAIGAAQTSYTWNVVGVLPGSDPKQAAVLLSAHMDHLGVGMGREGDQIYNGADDDASGVIAVLELARVLSAGARPRRTIYFVLFGSEERGGHGAQYFLAHPPLPLERIAANLEFEMIGRPDPKVAAGTLWLTGYERSNLGAELARQGARLVADPHPEQNFFQRSDNYALAQRGVVAHTVSSFGVHPEYHRPQDDIAHIDFAHMTRAINAMVRPVIWLANSKFTPAWVEGKKP